VGALVKRIHIDLDNEEFEELKKRKDKLGLSCTQASRVD